jgi:hypothetical protein
VDHSAEVYAANRYSRISVSLRPAATDSGSRMFEIGMALLIGTVGASLIFWLWVKFIEPKQTFGTRPDETV